MLPPALSALEMLAWNLWWSWDAGATELWRSVDPWRWNRCRHNPIAMLREVEHERWDELSRDEAFRERLAGALSRMQAYLSSPGWCATAAPDVHQGGVAYFSMEFGLHESLRTYSGGLGVLAGDHLRSASDLGVPLVGVSLLYRAGYFRQVFDDGAQGALYPEADFSRLPVRPCLDDAGSPVLIPVPIAHRNVFARVFSVSVGRNLLYLLDTDHPMNDPADRALTHTLYGGDDTMRIGQEILLGIGGLRALRALGLRPAVYHLNEGHCAFMVLDLLLEQRARGRSRQQAWDWIRRRVAFTTHTPVPAGHDRFGWAVVDGALGPWRAAQMLPPGAYMDLGRVRPGDVHEPLCNTVLALRFAGRSNAVSALHGETSRRMWHEMWPDRAQDEVPIGHITNGVHPVFWMAEPAQRLFDAHLGTTWRDTPWDEAVWAGVDDIPDEALWELRNALLRPLATYVSRHGGPTLRTDALTIGFARRFAPYKRGDLLFTDPDRLEAFLDRTPAQVVFAGKSHPHDKLGRDLIARVLRFAAQRRFRHRIVFLADHDIALGRLLTSGVDLWLNNPRRPHEASGTSGQKVPLNGGLNLSVLDGWWPEAYDGANGWAIGSTQAYSNQEAQDRADAESLYTLLEGEIGPLWARRDTDGRPAEWLTWVRQSIRTCAPRFNSHRMVRDYVTQMYAPLVSLATHG